MAFITYGMRVRVGSSERQAARARRRRSARGSWFPNQTEAMTVLLVEPWYANAFTSVDVPVGDRVDSHEAAGPATGHRLRSSLIRCTT